MGRPFLLFVLFLFPCIVYSTPVSISCRLHEVPRCAENFEAEWYHSSCSGRGGKHSRCWEVVTPKSATVSTTKEAGYSLARVRDSLKQLKGVDPPQGLKRFMIKCGPTKDIKARAFFERSSTERPYNSWDCFKSPLGGLG